MAVKIRLLRCGKKKKPFYRVVVANAESPRDGKFLELIGHYNPFIDLEKNTENKAVGGAINADTGNKEKFVIATDRLAYWLGIGAKPTDRIKLFISKMNNSKLEKFSTQYKKEIEKSIVINSSKPKKEAKKK